MEWQEPSIECTKYQSIVAYFECEDDDGEKYFTADIFTFDWINNCFRGSNGHPHLKLRELEGWMPLPEVPNNG